MSANNQQIMKRMREAGVPSYAFKTTLEIEKQPLLREIVASRDFEKDGELTNYMIHAGDRMNGSDIAKIVSVMAKELVLSNVPVKVATMSHIARELRMDENRPDYESDILSARGDGYVVIPGFLDTDGMEPQNLAALLDWLCSHCHRGGGVILGASIWVAATPSVYGATFSAFARTLQEIQIKIC